MTDATRKPYSIRKSRHILRTVYAWYKKKGPKLSPPIREDLENEIEDLDNAILYKQRDSASTIAKRLESFAHTHCKKSVFEYTKELIFALLFALVIAVIVRQMWFELYEIPTGSMRPTFREQDHLTVTKTAFGINTPLATEHLYFDPSLVERTAIFIFSGDGLPLLDTDTTYFGIFPYKKRYIKRCMGKPGDTVYFYGGQVYSVDSEGRDLTELRESPWMLPLEHIPFISFEGELAQASDRSIILKQMHLPAGKISLIASGTTYGEVYNGTTWVKDQPLAQTTPHDTIETYSDLMGIRNFAMARLLTKDELKDFLEGIDHLEEGVLYLQLHHTPSLNFPKPLLNRSYVGIPAYSTIIPLQQHHLDAILDNLYTSRFTVENGHAALYGEGAQKGPLFPGVEDGTYEFYFGKASRIGWAGISTDIPHDNPLYSRDPKNIQKMFNLGIEMNTLFNPTPQNQTLFPHRYAYFRNGDLYIMGAPVLKKTDSTLISFNEREKERQIKATSQRPYVAFRDYGPPLKDGKIDIDFIRTFGITIPPNHYLALGDNHARSSDSRVFGFVPEDNLQGAPCLIFWPPGDRLGHPAQKPYPILNTPRLIVWSVVALVLAIWYTWHRRNLNRPIVLNKRK